MFLILALPVVTLSVGALVYLFALRMKDVVDEWVTILDTKPKHEKAWVIFQIVYLTLLVIAAIFYIYGSVT